MIRLIKGLLSGGKAAYVHCLTRGHTWEAQKESAWSEIRACKICGAVEERRIRGDFVYPWKRIRCQRR